MTIEAVAFVLVAFGLLGSAVRVVTSKNLVHTVLWLGVSLAATSVVFVMLSAPFLAAMQLMLYTGGVLTLMLFGVMLTTRDEGFMTIPNSQGRLGAGAALALGVFAMLGGAILRTPSLDRAPGDLVSTAALGEALLTDHALAFEALSVLLLVAALGAIVLARRRDAGDEPAAPARGVIPRPAKGGEP